MSWDIRFNILVFQVGPVGGMAYLVLSGVVGGIGFLCLNLGSFEQGFLLGAVSGGIAAYFWGDSYLYGKNNLVYSILVDEYRLYKENDIFSYLTSQNFTSKGAFSKFLGGGFGGASIAGTILLATIVSRVPNNE